jgi:hypothetical protein
MMEIIKYGDFKPLGKQKKKSQIILTHTSRNVENYLASLRYRYNGKFNRIPNYVVTKKGEILKLLDNVEHTNFFNTPNINRNSIIISLENLGWLEKQPLTNNYVNWIGDIYTNKPFERRWRDYFFWDFYTENQINSLSYLCGNIISDMKITKDFVGNNTKFKGVDKFEGVVTRSNYDSNYTDLSPAFDFDVFIEKIL